MYILNILSLRKDTYTDCGVNKTRVTDQSLYVYIAMPGLLQKIIFKIALYLIMRKGVIICHFQSYLKENGA